MSRRWRSGRGERARQVTEAEPRGPTAEEPTGPEALGVWLQGRATVGAIGNVVAFTLLAATAASRAAHGVLSPAGLVAVVVGAAVAATTTGWVAGVYEGADAVLRGQVGAVEPAPHDVLAGRSLWRGAARWAGGAAVWSTAAAVVLAAVLRQHSAPFPVLAVALLAIAVPAAVAVDVAARATGAAVGAALRTHAPLQVSLLGRAWRDLALPAAGVQTVVNAGAAWLLFHGAASDGSLTKGAAFADIVIVAALLAVLFGSLGARWGAVDALSGRVAPEPAAGSEADDGAGRRPLGPQALVYAAGLTVVATSMIGIVVPAVPSLLRVALVRGLLAGGLTLVACALGVVRGALSTAPLALGSRPELPTAGPRPSRRPARRLASLAGASAVVAVLALAAAPLVRPAPPAAAQDLEGLGLVAELDALGVRVEYDIPLPAGIGSAPQVVGTVRRTGGSEAANGVAAAPTRFDAVVGGTLANPDKEPATGDESALPQSECAYPGPLADIDFTFPADVRPDTAGAPPIGWSTAQCGAGPALQLHATSASPDQVLAMGPAVSVAGGVADAVAGPVHGVLSSTASARTDHVSVLDGLLTVDAVIAHGTSSTDGQPGGAHTDASVDLVGVSVAGTRFDVRGGDLVVDGQEMPLAGDAAGAVLSTVSAALAPSGCQLTVLDDPASYPQGFLFTRPLPELGIAEDGTMAGSMAGGLLLQCDLPQDLSEPTGFNPQRVQVVLGFAYTGVAARADIGGFNLGDVGAGTPLGGSAGGLVSAGRPFATGGAPAVVEAPGAVATTPAPRAPAPASAPVTGVTERIELLAANFAAGRTWVWLGALALWVLATHLGVERVRRAVSGAVG